MKGFYERPLADLSAGAGSLEGGRVTELVARPLIALEWPELAWLVQPLAGEWAVRRDLFEQLSVPTGYAVELAALIDTVRLLGPEAIAQVDLGRRAHRHQALRDLGSMAVQILAASNRRSRGSAPDHVVLDQPRKAADEIETIRNDIPLTRAPTRRETSAEGGPQPAGGRAASEASDQTRPMPYADSRAATPRWLRSERQRASRNHKEILELGGCCSLWSSCCSPRPFCSRSLHSTVVVAVLKTVDSARLSTFRHSPLTRTYVR